MKVIIAGSRGIESFKVVCDAISASGFDITEVVSGCARGVDKLGERWSREIGGRKPKLFPAPWRDKTSPTYMLSRGYDPTAGRKRNRQMAEYADALIAIWDGRSDGTRHMIEVAREVGLKVFVYRPSEGSITRFTNAAVEPEATA